MPRPLARNFPYAPFQMMGKWREWAAMIRHRGIAVLAPGARILNDGWVINPGARENIYIGPNTLIRGELLVFPHGGRIDIGEWCFVGHASFLWSAKKITIGHRCLISHHVNIHDTDSHAVDPVLRHNQFAAIAKHGQPQQVQDIPSSPIHIADDVWIGSGATILKGVSIGEGAIVGAAAVVTQDVEAWTVVAGNPARLIKRIPPDKRRVPT